MSNNFSQLKDHLQYQFHRFALKARINSRDVLSEAIKTAYKSLKDHIENRETDLDQEIKVRNLNFLYHVTEYSFQSRHHIFLIIYNFWLDDILLR